MTATSFAGKELAGPAQPVGREERIPVLDVIRGAALLGILLSNIVAFSGPMGLDDNPTLIGNHVNWNVAAWMLHSVFVEGKMRAVFCMLFGAGVLLQTGRAEARGLGARTGDIFARRNLWLMIFGVLHAYLLWFGDILYRFGLLALLFLFPFRRAGVKQLFIAGVLLLVAVEVPMIAPLRWEVPRARLVNIALAHRAAGQTLPSRETDALTADAGADERILKERGDDLLHMRGGYLEIVQYRARRVKFLETESVYTGFGDALGMMLIGMGLFRTGFLRGAMRPRVYISILAIGLPIWMAGAGLCAWVVAKAGFTQLAFHLYLFPYYQFFRLVGALVWVALTVLICGAGWSRRFTRPLAAVGQMAFTNYILSSLLCSLLFNGYGWKMYGELEYYQLIFCVLAVWAVILFVSPLWLKRFRFGPLEWAWRSLTYWQWQPILAR